MHKNLLYSNIAVLVLAILCFFGNVGPDYGRVSIFSLFETDLFSGVIMCFVFVIISIIFSIVALVTNNNPKTKIIWPVGVNIATSVLSIVNLFSINGFGGIIDVMGFFPWIIAFLNVASIVICIINIVSDTQIAPKYNYTSTSNSTSYSQINTNKPTEDVFDKLKKYKELLDSGVITEEEFIEKKKELLKQ